MLSENLHSLLKSTRALAQTAEDRQVQAEAARAAREERLAQAEAVARAEGLLKPLAEPMEPAQREAIYRKFKDEEEAASSGMGLFFTE